MSDIVAILGATLHAHPAAADSPPVARATVASVVNLWVTKIEQLTIPAADALPETLYAFVPTGGDRGQALGEEPPAGTRDETAPPSVKTKSDIMAYLKGSFAALHRAATGLIVQNVETPIAVRREPKARLG